MILLLMIFVVTYPLVGAQKGLSDGPRVRIPSKENEWSHHQCLFKENVGKTKLEKVEGLRI